MFLIQVKFNFKYVSKMKGNCGAYKIEEIQSSDRQGRGKRYGDLVQMVCELMPAMGNLRVTQAVSLEI
jgi:hypothetical protein